MEEIKGIELMKLEYEFYSNKAELHYKAVESTIKLYFILVAGFLSVITYTYKDNFNALRICYLNDFILGITIILFIIGLMSLFKVAEHRLLLISYVRSLNATREWFVDNYSIDAKYFVFKPDKSKPAFFRRFRHFYWEYSGLAVINSFFGLTVIYNFFPTLNLFYQSLFLIIIVILEMQYYRIRANSVENEFR